MHTIASAGTHESSLRAPGGIRCPIDEPGIESRRWITCIRTYVILFEITKRITEYRVPDFHGI